MVEQKTENPHGVRVLDFGGGEESRTPVRKPIPTAFYERIPSFGFPRVSAAGQALTVGSL